MRPTLLTIRVLHALSLSDSKAATTIQSFTGCPSSSASAPAMAGLRFPLCFAECNAFRDNFNFSCQYGAGCSSSAVSSRFMVVCIVASSRVVCMQISRVQCSNSLANVTCVYYRSFRSRCVSNFGAAMPRLFSDAECIQIPCKHSVCNK